MHRRRRQAKDRLHATATLSPGSTRLVFTDVGSGRRPTLPTGSPKSPPGGYRIASRCETTKLSGTMGDEESLGVLVGRGSFLSDLLPDALAIRLDEIGGYVRYYLTGHVGTGLHLGLEGVRGFSEIGSEPAKRNSCASGPSGHATSRQCRCPAR